MPINTPSSVQCGNLTTDVNSMLIEGINTIESGQYSSGLPAGSIMFKAGMNEEEFSLLDDHLKEELLKVWVSAGKIDSASLQEYRVMKDREKYLSMHKNTITEKKDGRWSTRLPVIERGEILSTTRPVIKHTREELLDTIVDHYRQLDVNPSLYDLYYEYQRINVDFNGKQEATFTRNMTEYNRYFLEFGKRRILSVTEEDIENFLITNKQEHRLTSRQYGKLVSIIKCIFNYARAKHIIDYSITNVIENVAYINNGFTKKEPHNEYEVFTDEEYKKLIPYWNERTENSTYLGLRLCAITGVRVGELSTLRLEDCTESCISIHRTETTYKDPESGKMVCTVKDSPKTANGVRTVDIPTEAQWIVPRLKELNPGGEWLFMTYNNKTHEYARTRAEYFRKLPVYYKR